MYCHILHYTFFSFFIWACQQCKDWLVCVSGRRAGSRNSRQAEGYIQVHRDWWGHRGGVQHGVYWSICSRCYCWRTQCTPFLYPPDRSIFYFYFFPRTLYQANATSVALQLAGWWTSTITLHPSQESVSAVGKLRRAGQLPCWSQNTCKRIRVEILQLTYVLKTVFSFPQSSAFSLAPTSTNTSNISAWREDEDCLHFFFPWLERRFLVPQVLIAVGRDACTDKVGLDKIGVKVNPK